MLVPNISIHIRRPPKDRQIYIWMSKASFCIMLHWASSSAQLLRKIVLHAFLDLRVDVIAHLPCKVMQGGHLY